jgi:hypothetical protein
MFSHLIGKRVIVRTFSAGVHFGTLTSLYGKQVILANSRRIWSWSGAFTLSEISQAGLSVKSRLSIAVPEIYLTEAIEVIPCSPIAAVLLTEMKSHE